MCVYLVVVPLLQQVVVAGGAGAHGALRVLGARARRPRVLLAEDGEVRLLVLQRGGGALAIHGHMVHAVKHILLPPLKAGPLQLCKRDSVLQSLERRLISFIATALY